MNRFKNVDLIIINGPLMYYVLCLSSDVGSLHIVVRPHATESCWTWVKKTFFKSLWKKERRLLDAMPVSDELRQSTDEPLFGVTDFTLRIKFSDFVSA